MQKSAVKKVIAAMTVGKDVSMLFPDVTNCMQTDNLELKKLVYLYLINYAKTQPDLAIMAVNTFVKDTQDPNPLIRALAVRTMGCIRVDKITEYLCDPLQRCLRDEDPYVRKTAAVCVAKLFDISAELVQERGFLDALVDMLADSNPMVVANAVAALTEISDASSRPVFQVNQNTLFKLLAALNECTEWGQVFILDAITSYKARDARDAESIVERVTPRLQHANSAVVLSAVKVVMRQMEVITSPDMLRSLQKKMAPPLVTLLSSEPEIQYVALRNINLIVQRRPGILSHEIKVFFCKYNDPIYCKIEKLEIMVKLANDRNIDQVLQEFKEYATEVDVDFVRKSVRAIGRCAISLERAAERCINVLLELIQTKVNYVVQEAIVVIKDIFRRYPNQYESIIATLCDNLDTLDEPAAKASMIWIIGEYAERIDNADELLEAFLESFPEEPPAVQLQLLTATVKLFLKRPTEAPQQMIQVVLSNATQETDNPDLRDRAYIYWRLLSTDPEAAKDVVLAEKPTISDDSNNLDPAWLDLLLGQMSTLASVYHKPPEAFVTRQKVQLGVEEPEVVDASSFGATTEVAPAAAQPVDPLADLMGLGGGAAPAPAAPAAPVDPLADLMGMGGGAPAAPAAGGGLDDLFGASAPAATAAAPSMPVLLDAGKGNGLEISGRLVAGPAYVLCFTNRSQATLDGFAIQFNKNSFGLAAAAALQVPAVAPGGSADTRLQMGFTGQVTPAPAVQALQVAVKCNTGVYYFADTIPLEAAAVAGAGPIEQNAFLEQWRALPDNAAEVPATVAPADALAKLQGAGLGLVAKRPGAAPGAEIFYMSAKVAPPPGADVLVEVTVVPGHPTAKVVARSQRADLAPFVHDAAKRLLA